METKLETMASKEKMKELEKVSDMLTEGKRFCWEGGSVEYELRCFVTVLFDDENRDNPDYLSSLLLNGE